MPVALDKITVGKCFITEIGQVRRVLKVESGMVTYEARGKTATGDSSWGARTTVGDGKFARAVDREVTCDYDPNHPDRTSPQSN
jgi:hypothetical protein